MRIIASGSAFAYSQFTTDLFQCKRCRKISSNGENFKVCSDFFPLNHSWNLEKINARYKHTPVTLKDDILVKKDPKTTFSSRKQYSTITIYNYKVI